MAFYLSGIALHLCRRLVLVLMLSFLLVARHRTQALHCIQQWDAKEPQSISCGGPAKSALGCMAVTMMHSDGSQMTGKSCQTMPQATLECLRREGSKRGVIFQGNCFGGPNNEDWKDAMDLCAPRKAEDMRRGNQEVVSFHMCTCNDGDNCNAHCECDPSYGLCGAHPCDSMEPSVYNCHCGGVSPQKDAFTEKYCSTGGYRQCPEKVSSDQGCYTMAQENRPLFRDCVDEMSLVKCMHRKMKPSKGPGNCVTGTYAQWKDAIAKCASSLGLVRAAKVKAGQDNGRVKACYCIGDKCNGKEIHLDDNAKSTGNGVYGGLAWVTAAILILKWVQ